MDYADIKTEVYTNTNHRIVDIIIDWNGSGTFYYILDINTHFYAGIKSVDDYGSELFALKYNAAYGTYLKGTMNSDGSLIALMTTDSTNNLNGFGFLNTTDRKFRLYKNYSIFAPYSVTKRNVDVKFSPNDGSVFLEACSSPSNFFTVGYVCRYVISTTTYR